MVDERAKRKLTAILSADVKGYSRMMGEDELSTIETLKKYRELIDTLVQQYRGRVVDSPGDNMLTEFSSVVDAVDCAVKIQKELKLKNDELPENRRMEFRIGVNLGDVVEDGERIYGDGVNIAARVESLAEGGGICVSGTAYDQIGKKLDLGYEYLGEQAVKNIEKPVRVYRVLMEPEEAGKVIGEERPKPKHWRWAAIGGVVVLIMVVAALAIWNLYFRPAFEPASVEKMAFPLPEKPSIAVLPFENLSGDPDQEYIADGLTENIITALSKIPEMFVIARNSVFAYKGKPVDVRQVSEELGVRYVLEGSIQKAGDKLRVTAQLIDATKGHHLWAERFDRPFEELFAVQDEITLKILTGLQVELTLGEQLRFQTTKNLEAWGYFIKAVSLLVQMTKEDNAKARELVDQATELDPQFAGAWNIMAWTHLNDARWGWSESREDSFRLAYKIAQKTLSMDDTLPDGHSLLGTLYLFQRQYDEAIAEGERSIALDPNSATNYALLAQTLHYADRFEESIALLEKAMRLHPYYPGWYLIFIGANYSTSGRHQEAIAIYKQLLDLVESRGEVGENFITAHLSLASNHIALGMEEEARAHVDEILKRYPVYSLESVRGFTFYKDPVHLEKWLTDLRKAGMPETPLLPLPDKPSIAVLPFVNMSDDPKQEYFSDGITEEIITALSKTPKMFVIARTSSFKYKGKEVDVRTVGRELGVRYVLEGSVRKSDDKVRITAQLIDAKTNNHLWAERYDRVLKDIFAIQDDITKNIITEIQVQLTEGIQVTLLAGGTRNLMAYLKTLEAVSVARRVTVHEIALMKHLSEEAIALDPEYAAPYAILGNAHLMDLRFGVSKSPKESMGKAIKFCTKSLSLDGSNLTAIGTLSFCYATIRKHDEAIRIAEQGIAKMPGAASAHMSLGRVLVYSGRHREAIESLKLAIRMNPYPPTHYFFHLGDAHFLTGEYKDAILAYKKAADISPNSFLPHIGLAAVYGLQGREAEARSEAEKILKIYPKYSLEASKKRSSYKNPEDTNRFYQGLSKAGLK